MKGKWNQSRFPVVHFVLCLGWHFINILTISNTSLYKSLVVVECNPFWFTTTKINALLALWKFAKYYVGNFHNPSLIVQEICIRCNWQQFYFHFLPHSLGFIHSFWTNAKTEHEWWRSPEDENNHQPLDLQPKRGGPDQHLVQQHLQLHLHEEQVPALNSTSTCLRGLRNVPNFLNSQSNDHDQLFTLECLILARLCI